MGIGDFISDITPDSVEDAVEDGVEWVGNRVEDAGTWTADRLDDVGWESGADWVREHADELGVVRVGRRLRFDPDRVTAALAARTTSKTPAEPDPPVSAPRTRRRRPPSADASAWTLPERPKRR